MADHPNRNRNWVDPGSTVSNQDDTSRRLGIPIDNATARPLNDIRAATILPASGSLRTTPSAAFGSGDGKGNRTRK
jgi:hypothetical protein